MAAASAKAKTSSTAFAILNQQMVYNPKTSEGSGFLPPLLRSLTHITYALGIAEDELPKTSTTSKTNEVMKKVQAEIEAAIGHFDKVEINDAFSQTATEQLKIFHKTLNALNKEFGDWDRDTQITNLTSLINKLLGVGAMLDRELLGMRDSDPGSNL